MLARLFPGQGVQHAGMGAELFADFAELCARASELLGYDIVELCVADPHRRLQSTEYAQPAIFFVSALEHLRRGGDIDCYAGHSLGELNALVAAECLDLLAALELVAQRGRAMAAVDDGGMLAVRGLTRDALDDLIVANGLAAVYVANHNSDVQVAVAGERQLLRQLARLAVAAGAAKVTPLNVSGPFHTPLMTPARLAFERTLAGVEFRPGRTPVVSSASGELFDTDRAAEILAAQISTPVEWVATVRTLRRLGVTAFDEVNGQTLTKLGQEIHEVQGELA